MDVGWAEVVDWAGWAIRPSTFVAVWAPVAVAGAVLASRIRKSRSLGWWLACVLGGVPIGIPLTIWVPGVGLFLIPGFLTVWLIWYGVAKIPHTAGQWAVATVSERELARQLTDPGLIAAGCFFTLLAADLAFALPSGRLSSVGGAGFGDALLLQPVFIWALMTLLGRRR